MKKIIKNFKTLPGKKRIEITIALLLLVAVMIAVPVYSWFSYQRKAAEMFKVEYPNALYINAAHREDRIYFDLDAININDYKIDPITKQQVKDANNEPVKVTQMMYVFSVSGSNTQKFLLQLGHTTNNLFTYTIYEAQQYKTSNEALAAVTTEGVADKDKIVRYTQHEGSHTENTLQVIGDLYSENDDDTSDLYYVKGNKVDMTCLNPGESAGLAAKNGTYYQKTYGSNNKVQNNAVPLYWQKEITLKSSGENKEIDSNKKFCKYFIIVVTWNDEQQALQEDKESDLIYLSVQRTN